MEIRHTDPSRLFVATNGGAGLNFDHPCAHGIPAVSLHLFSHHHGTSEDIGILLPSCVAPSLFGAAIAYVQAACGSETAEQFIADLLTAKEQALEVLAARRAKWDAVQAACCEAGFRTQGREHTCQPSTDSPS